LDARALENKGTISTKLIDHSVYQSFFRSDKLYIPQGSRYEQT